jgi:hypothetical protein
MCTCIVSLRAVCWLLSSWCFVSIRKAAHICANGYANGYDKDTDVDIDIGVKSVYIGALGSRE